MHLFIIFLLSAAPQWDLTTSLSFVYGASPAGDGGVWCASSGGAFHFDSGNGVGDSYLCPEHLPVPDCRAVLEDSGGRLWFATGGAGLVMYDGSSWSTFSSFEGIPGEGTVTSLLENSGEIWVGCSGGVAHGDERGFTPVGEAFVAEDVYSMSARNDTLWFATDQGILSLHDPLNPLNPASWTHWEETRKMDLEKVVTGLESVYACGRAGLAELLPDSAGFVLAIDYSLVEDSMVTAVLEQDGELYASVHGLVLRRHGEDWITAGTGLSMWRWPVSLFAQGEDIFCSVSYQTNILDISNTQSGIGLYRLSGTGEWEFIEIPGLQCKKVHQMAAAADGRIYLGSYSRGLQAMYPGNGWRGYGLEEGMPNTSQTFSVAISHDGNGVWTSSYHHGLSWVRDNGTWETQGDTILTFYRDSLEYSGPYATLIEADIPNNQPVMLATQTGGNWCAFRQFDPSGHPDEPSGILGFNGNPMGTMNWAPRVSGSGIAAVNVRSVYPVSPESLWIAFEDGAGCQLLVHSGNPADDSEDSWYPGTGQGYNMSSGLPSEDVFCFLEVPGTGLLAATGLGLARWTGSGFTSYSSLTQSVRAMSLDSAGRIWCLTAAGIYSIADGDVSFYNEFNSEFLPPDLFSWEFSLQDPVSGGVFLSSEDGLWLVKQSGGGQETGNGVAFYPQPFISGENTLRITGLEDGQPISVDFYRLDGSFAGTLEAPGVSQWAWDGSLRGKIVSSGVYMVLVTSNEKTYQARISVVR